MKTCNGFKQSWDAWLFWIIVTTIFSVLVSILCLKNGIVIVFQNVFYIPIIIACVRYQRKGLYFSLVLSSVYLLLIVCFHYGSIVTQLSALLRVAAFIVVGSVISLLSYKVEQHIVELNKSQERYESLVDSIPGATYRCLNDEEWTMYFISSEISRLTGYPASDFIDNAVRSFASIVHPEDREFVRREIFEAIAKRSPYEIDYRMVTKNNEIIWVSERGKGSVGSEGNIQWLDGVIVNITDKKKAQLALAESKLTYQTIIDNSFDLIAIVDLEGKFKYCNRSYDKLLGYCPEELLGTIVFNILDSEDGLIAESKLQKGFEVGVTETLMNSRVRRKDGDYLTFSNRIKLLDYGGDKLNEILIVSTDISARIESEKELAKSNERLSTLLSNSGDILFVLDEENTILEYYSSSDGDLALSPSFFLGKKLDEIGFPEDSLHLILSALNKNKETKKKTQAEYSVTTSEGAVHWFNLTANSASIGDSVFTICVVNNITERKMVEQALHYQHSFNTLVASVSSSFVKASPTELDREILSAFESVSNFFGVDRSCIYAFNKKRDKIIKRFEWNSDEIEPISEGMSVIECDQHPWFCDQIKNKSYLLVQDDRLPFKDDVDLMVEWKLNGSKSFLCFPLRIDEGVIGFIGFDNVKKCRTWKIEEIYLIGIIAELITEAKHRRRIEDTMLRIEKEAAALAMVVTANHEISQPLMVLSGYFEILQGEITAPKYKKYFLEIEKSISRIKRILESMQEIEEITFTEYIEGTNMVDLNKEK